MIGRGPVHDDIGGARPTRRTYAGAHSARPAPLRLPFAVATDLLPGSRAGTDAVIGPTGLPDDPATSALRSVATHRGGGWIGRPQERPPIRWPAVPLVGLDIDRDDAHGYDDGQCRHTLWPVYHDLHQPARYERDWQRAFQRVNRRYAAAIAEQTAPAATVWIHDYKLQLVPGYLRRLRPDLRIGLSLPTHFPAPDLFHHLPMHHEILSGLLGADLLGFQSAQAAENFLILTHQVAQASTPAVGVYPTSVDTANIAELARRPDIGRRAQELRAKLGNPSTVILCMNTADHNQGIERRLGTLERLFATGRLSPADVTVIQVVNAPTQGDSGLADRVARDVARINGQFSIVGRPRVHYAVTTPDLEERVTLYLTSDILLATPLREGATAPALEFVAAGHDDRALVLSEFSGTATTLPDAFVVNPYDEEEVQAGIMAAVESSSEQRAARMRTMRAYVTEYDTHAWCRAFLIGLYTNEPRPHAHDDLTVPAPRWPTQDSRAAEHNQRWWLNAAGAGS